MIKIFSIFILFSGGQVYCQSIETDRPDQTESSATVPKGTLQIETGVGVEIRNNVSFGLMQTQRDFLLPTTLFRIALLNRLELRVVNNLRLSRKINFYDTYNQLGIDDLEIGFKAQVLNGNGIKPQISIMSHLSLPTGSFSTGNYGNITKLLVSHDFSNGMSLGYNLGYSLFENGAGDFLYSLAIGLPIANKLGVYIEGYGSVMDMENFDANADAGLTYLIKENIQFDYSFGVGISTRMNYHAIGCSIRIPN